MRRVVVELLIQLIVGSIEGGLDGAGLLQSAVCMIRVVVSDQIHSRVDHKAGDKFSFARRVDTNRFSAALKCSSPF